MSEVEAIINRDPAAYLSTCTDAIQFFPPDVSTVLGRDACYAYLADFPTPSSFTAVVQNLEGEGDLAYWQGQGQAQASFDDSSETTFTWLAIARKQSDGSWKMARDMWVTPGET